MNRAQHRRRIADWVTQTLVRDMYEEMGEGFMAYAEPDKRQLTIVDQEENLKVVYEDIRFCCRYHCWYDIERQAAVMMLDHFRYMILKLIKLKGDLPEWGSDAVH